MHLLFDTYRRRYEGGRSVWKARSERSGQASATQAPHQQFIVHHGFIILASLIVPCFPDGRIHPAGTPKMKRIKKRGTR